MRTNSEIVSTAYRRALGHACGGTARPTGAVESTAGAFRASANHNRSASFASMASRAPAAVGHAAIDSTNRNAFKSNAGTGVALVGLKQSTGASQGVARQIGMHMHRRLPFDAL